VTIFDLLFLVGALLLLVALLRITYQLIRGRSAPALALVRRTAAMVIIYFTAIVVTSLATPRRIVPPGTAQCFDDWCITVAAVARRSAGLEDSIDVTLQLSSRARGITQGERDVRIYATEDAGRHYQPIAAAGAADLSSQIPPLGTVTTIRRFVLPASASHPVLVVAHDPFPHCCIIADGESLLHRRTVVPLN
jgi:hypothetical protein